MVTRWKIVNYVLILLKMHWTAFINTSGNVLKIVTNKNGAKCPEKYGNMNGIKCMATRDNSFYKSTRDIKQPNCQLWTNIGAHSYILTVENIKNELKMSFSNIANLQLLHQKQCQAWFQKSFSTYSRFFCFLLVWCL